MSVFEHPDFDGHEQVRFFSDAETGLKAIVALHSSARGLALGGCRMRPYANGTEALSDVLRLSAGMTRKAAIVDLPFGGGKTVVWGDPKRDKTPELLRALGRALKTFTGRYLTGEDMNMEREDFLIVAEEAPNIFGVHASDGVKAFSPTTARGVITAMEAAVGDLAGKSVAVQGLGHVGFELGRLLTDRGARVLVADVSAERVAKAVDAYGAEPLEADAVYDADVDIFAPCAIGGVINANTIARLHCGAIIGAANNQLESLDTADALNDRGILYIPDYLANAGGLIAAGCALKAKNDGRPFDLDEVLLELSRISNAVAELLARSARDGVTPSTAAEDLALSRVHDPAAVH